jgi:hypothetical protein
VGGGWATTASFVGVSQLDSPPVPISGSLNRASASIPRFLFHTSTLFPINYSNHTRVLTNIWHSLRLCSLRLTLQTVCPMHLHPVTLWVAVTLDPLVCLPWLSFSLFDLQPHLVCAPQLLHPSLLRTSSSLVLPFHFSGNQSMSIQYLQGWNKIFHLPHLKVISFQVKANQDQPGRNGTAVWIIYDFHKQNLTHEK